MNKTICHVFVRKREPKSANLRASANGIESQSEEFESSQIFLSLVCVQIMVFDRGM